MSDITIYPTASQATENNNTNVTLQADDETMERDERNNNHRESLLKEAAAMLDEGELSSEDDLPTSLSADPADIPALHSSAIPTSKMVPLSTNATNLDTPSDPADMEMESILTDPEPGMQQKPDQDLEKDPHTDSPSLPYPEASMVVGETMSAITLSVDEHDKLSLSCQDKEDGEVESSDGEMEDTSVNPTTEKHNEDVTSVTENLLKDDTESFPVCKYFLQGKCLFGANCKFRHEKPATKSKRTDCISEGEISDDDDDDDCYIENNNARITINSKKTHSSDVLNIIPPFPPMFPMPPMFPSGQMPPPLFPMPLLPGLIPGGFPLLPTMPPPFLPTPDMLTPSMNEIKTENDTKTEDAKNKSNKHSGDENVEGGDEDTLQEKHWIQGLKSGTTAYNEANKLRENAKIDPNSQSTSQKNKDMKYNSLNKTSNVTTHQRNNLNPYISRFPKFSVPLFTPEYPEDDPDYSAFSRFKSVSSPINRKRKRGNTYRSRSRSRTKSRSRSSDSLFLPSPTSPTGVSPSSRRVRYNSSDGYELVESGSDVEKDNRSPLSHLTITSRSSSSTSISESEKKGPTTPPLDANEKNNSSSSSSDSSASSSDSSSSGSSSDSEEGSSTESSARVSPPPDGQQNSDNAEQGSTENKKPKVDKTKAYASGSDISDLDLENSDEDGKNKSDSKKLKLEKNHPSISFRLGGSKIKAAQVFATKKSKKIANSSPEGDDQSQASKKQDLPKKFEIIEAAKKEARELKEKRMQKRKLKMNKLKFVKTKHKDNSFNDQEQPSTGAYSFIQGESLKLFSSGHTIAGENVILELQHTLPPIILEQRQSDNKNTEKDTSPQFNKSHQQQNPAYSSSATSQKSSHNQPQAQPYPSQSKSSSNTSDGKSLSYKDKLLKSNLADTRRDDSHLKLESSKIIKKTFVNTRGRGRGRGGGGAKLITNKDGSITYIPYNNQYQQQQFGNDAIYTPKISSGGPIPPKAYNKQLQSNKFHKTIITTRPESSSSRISLAARKLDSSSKKKEVSDWKAKLMKELDSVKAQISEKEQMLD